MENQSANVVLATQTAFDQATALAVTYGFSILGAIVLLVGGWILSGVISRSAFRVISRIHGIDETLARFFQNLFHYGLLILVFVTVLGQFGVQTASIIAALGAAGLALGLALQGTLQNIAAGIMLLVLRPFRVGEYIETASVKGFIREIGLFATEMKTTDGLYLMAPNSTLWNTPIVNHSREANRRQELSVAIGNEADLGAAKQAVLGIVSSDERVRAEPAPRVFADDLTADQTVLKVEYWVKTREWTETRHDVIDRLKSGLVDEGIAIK
ncbi:MULTISPECIES: mechanosensitive ion channel family protein [Rhizobium]|uniref:Small-conductance mechanosensitive channel n=1 Tax=Rhizobium favelukesii TaxID=348824 RepID=W6RQC5_9HYPH|nr:MULTISPECIES: mechanosensitive ion channel domain-containing protein [Rhizobium]MCS0457865.1 mechanosensitive ion channel [Rhizobium favelukesii]UFS80509.1 mechanosensitive ion channel [Rhizobium sp. T136]CDM62375.1 small-conductance mechanosensitive channel [Rhizobium favelukesii]